MSGVTEGHLLNGRVRYAQPGSGFRTGIEPVLLAATIPARVGQRVLEGGTGAGAGLLCLVARLPGILGVGIEIDPGQAGLARANAASNGMADLEIVTGDLGTAVLDGLFDHAFANPPYHPGDGTTSPDRTRALAKQAEAETLMLWAGALARPLRARGTLSLILPAARLAACIAAMAAAGCPVEAVFPLWPKAGVQAKLTIVRGVKAGRGPLRMLPGLVLHEADGRFTPAADAVLRSAAALDLGH